MNKYIALYYTTMKHTNLHELRSQGKEHHTLGYVMLFSTAHNNNTSYEKAMQHRS